MPFEFKLPDIGEGVVEGEIVKWLINTGDRVEEDQPLVEVMTDKATVTIPSPRKGTITQTIGKEGEIVKVGATMIVIEEDGQAVGSPMRISVPASEEPLPNVTSVPPPVRIAEMPPTGEEERANGKVSATPATRRLARELGVDISRVTGRGPHGRVTKEDVMQFSAGTEAATPSPASSISKAAPVRSDLEERVPFVGLRRRIAEKMSKSKLTAAHFTFVDEVDMTALVALRKKLSAAGEESGVKMTYLPFIVKAVVAALKKYPLLNATLEEVKGELILKKYYNIGIAVAATAGLIVPVVKHAENKSLIEIAREIEEHASHVRNGTVKLDDLQGGTFTITSLGALGGLFATPIINYPEVAILGVNRIQARPVARDGQILIREIMYLSLSFDHRIVDGSVGAEFTKYLIGLLEEPSLLLMHTL